MRSVFRIDWRLDLSAVSRPAFRSIACAAALCATLSLLALPVDASVLSANAQEPASSTSTDAGSAALASSTPAAAAAPETAAADTGDDASAQVLNTPADVVSMNDIALDDQVLARQRGGATGLTMVAATPQLMRGSSVTLWDELAPPSPLPIPVDAARSAQGNAASYLRK